MSRSCEELRHAPAAPASRATPAREAKARVRSLKAVVRRFLGDDDVVDVALLQAGGGDAHEARARLQLTDASGAAIAHARSQAAHELLDHGRERPLVGDHALDALGHELARVGVPVEFLEVAVARAFLHGADGAHAAIALERAALAQDQLAGLSSVPAKSEPIITEDAPAAMAFTMSPENFTPPSAITGTWAGPAALAAAAMAVIWGIPAPETTRVVQMEPGPMPTLTAETPAATRSAAPSCVPTLPAITSRSGKRFL